MISKTWMSYVAGAAIVIAAIAAAVVLAAPGTTKSRLSSDTSSGCDGEQKPVAWDRFELADGGRTLRVIYYDSGSIRPCTATYESGAVGVFTANPSSYTLDLAPHCVTFSLPAGEIPPGLLTDSKTGDVHPLSLGLHDEFGEGPRLEHCVPVRTSA